MPAVADSAATISQRLRITGTLAYATPVLSTALLALSTDREWTLAPGVATLLVAGAAVLALRARRRAPMADA